MNDLGSVLAVVVGAADASLPLLPPSGTRCPRPHSTTPMASATARTNANTAIHTVFFFFRFRLRCKASPMVRPVLFTISF